MNLKFLNYALMHGKTWRFSYIKTIMKTKMLEITIDCNPPLVGHA